MKNLGSALLYYLVLKPVSLMPMPILYLLSSFARLVVFNMLKYRRKVIQMNLENSFPEKSEEELILIRKQFEKHFADILVESIKNFSISAKQAKARMEAVNTELFDRFAKQGRGVVLVGGHQNNWELWAVAAGGHIPMRTMAIYKRLANAFFDQKMRSSRGKFGLEMVPTKETSQWMKDHIDDTKCVVYAIDQSPANPKKAYWMNWLNQETAMYFGPEKHARQYDMAVVFGSIEKVKRGHYKVTYKLVSDDPKS
ncbi:MAG: lysophospholipid acyltransferase family protein, partial [Flavobacteriales bacterium]